MDKFAVFVGTGEHEMNVGVMAPMNKVVFRRARPEEGVVATVDPGSRYTNVKCLTICASVDTAINAFNALDLRSTNG